MTRVQAIEAALEQLAPEERAQFRAWFESFDAADWDQQFEQDIEAGALDWLAEEAMADLAAGHCSDRWNTPTLTPTVDCGSASPRSRGRG